MATGPMMMLKSMFGIDPDEIKSHAETILRNADDRLRALENDVANMKAALARIEMYLMPQAETEIVRQTIEVKESNNV